MNNKSYIMIHCIFLNENDIEKKLLSLLKEKVHQHWPNASIDLKMSANYWKLDGYKEAIFSISFQDMMNVHNFIKFLNLTWDFSSNKVEDVDSHESFQQESAVWSKIDNNSEIFLIPEVEWIHIYT